MWAGNLPQKFTPDFGFQTILPLDSVLSKRGETNGRPGRRRAEWARRDGFRRADTERMENTGDVDKQGRPRLASVHPQKQFSGTASNP